MNEQILLPSVGSYSVTRIGCCRTSQTVICGLDSTNELVHKRLSLFDFWLRIRKLGFGTAGDSPQVQASHRPIGGITSSILFE